MVFLGGSVYVMNKGHVIQRQLLSSRQPGTHVMQRMVNCALLG